MRTRIVPISHGKHTIQVVSKNYGRLTIHKHIGTFTTEDQKQVLLEKAREYIKCQTGQTELFAPPEYLQLKNVVITQSRPLFLYRLLCRIYSHLGLDRCGDPLIRDLIVTRVYQPQSKRETRDILSDSFGISYSLLTIYRHLKKAIDKNLKDQFQESLIDFARKGLNDSLRLVFYDVTTLAFDSQTKAGLKDFGFSKDHRFTDVQIVVGLVVNRQGFPLYFDIFNGRTFEGKTFISVIENIKRLLNNTDLVVIADAAMISRINVEELDKKNIGFIVGARLANLPLIIQDSILLPLASAARQRQVLSAVQIAITQSAVSFSPTRRDRTFHTESFPRKLLRKHFHWSIPTHQTKFMSILSPKNSSRQTAGVIRLCNLEAWR